MARFISSNPVANWPIAPNQPMKPFILFALLLSSASLSAANAAKPNLVIFLTDDHSVLDSTVYGAKDVQTPNMERIAAAGLTFDRAFVASPSCAPSRAALLTGLMPARNGAEPNHSKPRADLKKLPAYLQELGYKVAAFGKVSHYNQTKDYGFDHFAHDSFHDDIAVSAGIEWLRARKSGKPLCIFFGTNWPHVPWPEQSDYQPGGVRLPATSVDTPRTREVRTQYYAAVARMDAEMGAAYDAAREVLGADTFFLTTSDHGAQWPFGKWNLYDAGIRTPMIAVWPGEIAPGTRTKAMVSWIDILPTLVELGGGTPPADIDGRSFAAVLRGGKPEHRDRIFTTHSGDGDMNIYPIRSVRTAQWKYIRNLHPEFYFTTHIDLVKAENRPDYFPSWVERAKTDPWARSVVERYHLRPAEELYDLSADPHELTNLAGDAAHAGQLAALRAELDAWMKEQGDAGKIYGKPRLPTDPDRDAVRPKTAPKRD